MLKVVIISDLCVALKRFSFSLGFHYISRLAAANIGCASEEEKEFSSSLGFHYICKLK